jgi:hypothetical protein
MRILGILAFYRCKVATTLLQKTEMLKSLTYPNSGPKLSK